MHLLYIPVNERVWLSHLQSGHGLGMYAGQRYQRGSGFGAIFGPLLRSIMPIAKTVGKVVGKQALRTGAAVASDVLQGANLRDSIKTHGKAGLKRLVRKGTRRLTQKGRGLGTRPKGPEKTIKRIARKKKPIKRRKKRSRDALGLFE